MYKKCIILVLILFEVNRKVNGHRQSNNFCRASTGENGVCNYFSRCPSVQASCRYIAPAICFYNGYDPVVCCPIQQGGERIQSQRTSANLVNPRISEKKCQERYSQTTGRVRRQDFHITVVGGEPTAPGEYPYMAALGWAKENETTAYNCGGFLVDYNFVVTAAHCTSLQGTAPNVVRLGGGNLDNPGTDIPINGIFVHPRYNPSQQYNDIAVLRLASSSNELPACLWQTYEINNTNLTAIGYGHTKFAGQRSSTLMKVNLGIFSNQQCRFFYQPYEELPNGIIDSQVCIGDTNNAKDTCQGDSGGPVIVKTNINNTDIPYVVGVTSFGQGCAGETPSIYTRISSYLDFIESVVWPNGR